MAVWESESPEKSARTGATGKHRPQQAGEAPQRSVGGGALAGIAKAAATCAVSVALAAELIDRPVATWVHEHLGDERFGWFRTTYGGHSLSFGPFSFMASPAEAVQPLAVIAFAALAVFAAAGRRPGARGRFTLGLCLSVFASVEISGVAKQIFGRTWPESWLGDNPSWIRDGVFGFFPFHGGPGWGSFPSGHTTVIATVATILWLVWPELRIAWGALVAIVVVGLILGNYHFISDIIGGLYLGAGIGLAIVSMVLSPNGRLPSKGAYY